jgi:phosphoheptose isomerase
MDYYEIIANNFQGTIETIALSVDNLAEPIANASQAITHALLQDRKVLVCGNGADAALGQLFCSQLLNQFTRERPALPALTLAGDSASVTAIADSDGIEEIFSRQIRALGQPGDILLCISSGTAASNLLRAAQAAGERDMTTIAMTSADDHQLASLLGTGDTELAVAASRPAGVVELHTMILHSLCELIDLNLFGPLHQEP